MKALPILILSMCLSLATFGQAKLNAGMPAPQFNATDMNGEPVSLSDLRGKVVVMTFWSTRCPICHAEFPKLNQLVRSFDGKDVVFLAVAGENEDQVQNYLRKNSLTSRVLPNGIGLVVQYADRTANGNLNMGFPAYYVIDPQGTLRFRSSGWDKTPALSSSISRLLSPSVTGAQ